MKLELHRQRNQDKQTLGELFVIDKNDEPILKLKTLELPWKNNQKRVSCIPAGTFNCILHKSPRFGNSIWIQDVPGRSEILIHRGNYHTDILGCVLVGINHKDINGDGYLDVTSSKIAMHTLLDKITENSFKIEICDV